MSESNVASVDIIRMQIREKNSLLKYLKLFKLDTSENNFVELSNNYIKH